MPVSAADASSGCASRPDFALRLNTDSVNYMDGRTLLNTEAFSANSSGRQSDKAKAAGGLSEGGEDFVRIF